MLVKPKLPSYDIDAWRAEPFPERVRQVCVAWAADGYGTPLAVYGLYAMKIAGFVAAWAYFCTFTAGHSFGNISEWWASDGAFAKAILFTMLFEGLGFGCGSGPLTARYLPPLGGLLYFLVPGTTKLPLLPGLPVVGGHRRTVLDVGLYALTITALLVTLMAPAVTSAHLLLLVVLLPAMAIGDKTLFLVFRSEHYLSVVVCMLFATDAIAGAKFVWMAVWLWAATSKVNAHFPAVMGVMASNAPITQGTPVRRWVYRDFPNDLRPSRFAATLAHFGTIAEVVVPLVLVFSGGGPVTFVALGVIAAFHLFILMNVPMGVPLEWNVVMVYGALVLFGVHADVGILSITSPLLWGWLLGFHVALPLYGSLFPQHVSFLLSMRYYAGNWAYNVWLFKGDSAAKLSALRKVSPHVTQQLSLLYDDNTVTALLSKVVAFRHMHILGRALHTLVPKAVTQIDDYEWVDGEVMAGTVVGWNFGEGHLSNEQLMHAVQAQCGFEPGELRVICVESQPLFGKSVAWRVNDAATGQLEAGEIAIADLVERHPWPDAELQ